MSRVDPPCFGLVPYGSERVPSLIFTRSRDRTEFLRLADWLCERFPATVVERYGGVGADDKEYWTLAVAGSRWMLMRCYFPLGISLDGGQPGDIPAFEAIAQQVGARPIGWRYRWYRLRQWLCSSR